MQYIINLNISLVCRILMKYISSKNSLTSHYRNLIKLGLPIMVGQLGIIVLSIADTMMVGRYGTEELGAAGFVNNMFNLVIVFATGFSYGLTPVVGSMWGRNESNAIGRILKNALYVNAMTAFALMGLMSVLYLNIHRLGQPESLLPLMRPYYIVLLVSIIFVMLFNAFKQFSDGISDTVTPMYILLGGNFVNILGNWILIYGKFGFPELGLLGAGMSTLSSRILMLLVFVVIFFFSPRYAKYRRGFLDGHANRSDFRLLGKMGMPVGLQMGMETASFSLSTIMVGWLGTVALAAHQVMLTVGQFGFMMYYGMAAAVAVRASGFCGRGDRDMVRTTVNSGFHIILLMAAIVSVLLLVSRQNIGNLFTDNAEVVAAISQLVIPFVIYQFGDGMQCNYSNALRGISDVKMVTLYAFIAYFLISLPAGWFFGFFCGWGLTGIWMSFPLGLTSAGLMFMLRFRKSVRTISFSN